MKSYYPDWVLQHKKKNVEIRKFKENYYAYEIKSVWDKVEKRVRKKTVGYLGKVTPDGIIPPKHKRKTEIGSILEYGNIEFVNYFSEDLKELVKKHFPTTYDSIFSSAIIQLIYQSPLKNFSFRYKTSYLKKYYPNAKISENNVSEMLKSIGLDYNTLIRFFRDLNNGKKHLAMDFTHFFSESENINWLEKGYNSKKEYHNQLQFLLIYSIDKRVPSFFKVLPGSIRDVSSLVNAIHETNLKNVTMVTDKGFYSQKNTEFLDNSKLNYIIPVKRNVVFLEYYDENDFSDYFKFRDRFIWYKEYTASNKKVILYLDKKLKAEEETTYLSLIEIQKRTIEDYNVKKNSFGTISLLNNTKLNAEEAYKLFKSRIEIECAFDTLKNNLESDKTYMRSEESIRGYFFISFLALYLHCKIVNYLRKKDLLNKYSVKDVVSYLAKVYKVILDQKEIISEIPKKARVLVEKLDIPIT